MLVKESAFKDSSCRAPSRVTTRYLPFKLSEIIHIVFAQNFKLAIFDVHIYAVIVTSCVVKRGFRQFSRWEIYRMKIPTLAPESPKQGDKAASHKTISDIVLV